MKAPTAKTLKRKLWETVSIYIRLRDSDERGYCHCISCEKVKPWKEMDAGHFIPKNKGLAIYFEEDNIHAQCRECNSFLHGNLYDYGKTLEKKIGQKRIDELKALAKTTKKFTLAEYQAMIDYYKEKIEFLKECKLI